MSDWGGSLWGGTLWGGVYGISSTTHPTVSIGGVDRPYLMVGSSITKPKRGRATAQFTLFDISQSYRPVIGSPVVLTDGATSFVGLIVKIKEQRMDPETGVLDYVKYACECSDYGAIFDRRFVWRRYPAGSIAKNIILDIFRDKLLEDGFTATHVDGFTTIADELVFDGRSVTECFNQISDLTGEDWWLSGASGKDLYFKALAAAPLAPFSITDTSYNWRRLEVSYDSRSYRNRQYLRAGATLQSGTRTEPFTGNGIQWLFSTQFVLTAAPTITVNGLPQTVYEMNVDAYPAAGWFWTRGGGGVQQGTQTPPAIGATIVVQYGSYDSSVAMAEDAAAQAARAAIEGGSGVWESIDEARDVDNLTTAQALAAGILARHLDMPTEIQYETDVPGLEPGQMQPVMLSANGISAPVAGPELISNGDFASGASWAVSGAWSIGSGVATATAAWYADLLAQPLASADPGQYRITWTMTHSGGTLYVRIGSDSSAGYAESGTYSVDIDVHAGDGILYVYGTAFYGTVDNISVRKLASSDLTVPYYVTQVNSTDIGSPFPGTPYFYRHRVTLSSARDQGDWLAWWLNFYRQAKAFSTASEDGVISHA